MDNKYDAVMDALGFYYIEGQDRRPTAPADIEKLEREIGSELPHEYKVFLLKYGITGSKAGRIWIVDPDGGRELGGVEVFLGLNPGTRHPGSSYDLVSFTDGLHLPPHFFPIALSPGGLIGIILGGDRAGEVQWFDPHGGAEDPADDTVRVADSFDAFMHSLCLR